MNALRLFATILAVAIVIPAAGEGQSNSSSATVEGAIKDWVTCLHGEAQRAKTSGASAEEAVQAAYSKCGDGETSLTTALTIVAPTISSEAEQRTVKEAVKRQIRGQVFAVVNGLAAFQFRELIAGRNFNLNSPGLKNCKKNQQEITCTELFDNVSGVPAITSYTIYNGKLYSLWISTERENLPTLLLAFNQKYGQPCKNEVKTVQNRLGNTFQSTEMTWCFNTGKMVAREIGPRITHSMIVYTDEVNAPPTALPTVDF